MNKTMDNKKSKVLCLITDDLDIISADEVVKNKNGEVLSYIINNDGLERIAHGNSIEVFIEDTRFNKVIRCKNGPFGWIEYYDNLNKKQMIKGNVLNYLAIKFNSGEKSPKVKYFFLNLDKKI